MDNSKEDFIEILKVSVIDDQVKKTIQFIVKNEMQHARVVDSIKMLSSELTPENLPNGAGSKSSRLILAVCRDIFERALNTLDKMEKRYDVNDGKK